MLAMILLSVGAPPPSDLEIEKAKAAVAVAVAVAKLNEQVPPAPVVVASGCGCQPHVSGTPWDAGTNCGSYSCKSNGGKGCGDTCPVKANPSAAAPVQTYTLPSASSGGCANGQCSPGRTGWHLGKLLGR